MEKKGYKKLKVWEKADEFALRLYIETRNFPKDELYGITSQLRRACLSIVLNIVEGMGRQHPKELKQFINISLGSHAETEYLLEFSKKLGYLTEEKYRELENRRAEVGKLLWSFYKSLK